MQIVTWMALGALGIATVGGGVAGVVGAITANRTASSVALGASVATFVLGLVGTVCGLIVAFGAVADVDPSEKAVVLSEGIRVAMRSTEVGIGASLALVGLGAVGVFRSVRIARASGRERAREKEAVR